MKALFYSLAFLAIFGCSDSGKKKAATNKGGTATPTAGNSSQRDIIFINAIGDEATLYAPAQQAALTSLLTGLVKKFAADKEAKLVVFASPSATLSKVSINTDVPGVDKSRVLQVNFEMAPRDALLGTTVAGCAAADSNLDADHTAATIKVCSQTVTVPEHSWAWGVEDLKGKMHTFLRPGARRDYIIVASNDPVLLTASEFLAITKTQNAEETPRVFVLSPITVAAPCTDLHKATFVLSELAQSTGGQAFEFCSTDWSSAIDGIITAL